jgi:hypothetical protein
MSDSVDAAIAYSRGAFQQIDILAVNDTCGQLSLSNFISKFVFKIRCKIFDFFFKVFA